MERQNAMTEDFVTAEIFGHPGIFTETRIDRKTVPETLFMYEIRHSDDNDSLPAELCGRVLVNFYGTILLDNPLTLDDSGSVVISEDDILINWDEETSVAEYQTKYGMLPMRVYPARKDELCLFFRAKKDIAYPLIGYVRGDFGHGDEFWHSWHCSDPELQTPEFEKTLNEAAEYLREAGILRSLADMARYCASSSPLPADRPFYGYKLQKGDYQFYIKCLPQKGDYNFYIMCYLKEDDREKGKN